MNNRIAVTVRMNLEDQREMRDLVAFYKRDPKTLMKMGFALLVEATKATQKDMASREEAAKGASELNKGIETEGVM